MIAKILPPIIIFVLGYFLKYFKLLGKEAGDTMLKIVFYLAQPAAILISLSALNLERSIFFLPFIAVLIALSVLALSFLISSKMNLTKKTQGSFLVGTTVMNMGFLLPFILAGYGNEGFARAALFDAGNGILTFTLVYYLAVRFGGNGKEAPVKKILYSPPIWAIVVAIIINALNLHFPPIATQTLQSLANLIIPLIMLSLGIYFNPKIFQSRKEIVAVVIRMAGGLLVGFVIAKVLGLSGVTRAVVILGAAAPIGYNTLTFAKLENLDEEFAANAISFSIAVALILIPLLIFLINV